MCVCFFFFFCVCVVFVEAFFGLLFVMGVVRHSVLTCLGAHAEQGNVLFASPIGCGIDCDRFMKCDSKHTALGLLV